ncbi:MAG: hypothetical protein K8H88_31100 [Sandaracinaceae bacterium]|nr:hypothetical protein [Sandaracinaceae bacterium]
MDDELPRETLRALSAILVVIFEIARDGTRRVVDRIRPIVSPPDGLRLTGGGVLYTGVVVIEGGRVIAGIVIEVGRERDCVAPSPTSRSPLITPPSRFDDPARFHDPSRPDRSGRLPGWAEDSRDPYEDDEEEPLWRRR